MSSQEGVKGVNEGNHREHREHRERMETTKKEEPLPRRFFRFREAFGVLGCIHINLRNLTYILVKTTEKQESPRGKSVLIGPQGAFCVKPTM